MTIEGILTGLAGALLVFAGKAAFEKLTRQATDPETRKLAHSVKAAVHAEIELVTRDLESKVLKIVNGAYVKSNKSTITGDEFERRLKSAEEDLDKLDRYAHANVHDFNGKLTPIQLELDRNTEYIQRL